MRITFGRVMAYIIITLFIYFVIVYIIDRIEDKRYRESCPHGMQFKGSFKLNSILDSEVAGAKIYALDKQTGKVVDSATISNSSGYYYFDKELNTGHNWKIKLNNGEAVLITDIKTVLVEYRTSFSPVYVCEIKEWKVNGKQYNSDTTPEFID